MRIILECKGQRREFPLKEGVNTIGRGAGCDVRYSDPSLSRKHLEVTVRGGEVLVRDLETHNGTFLGPQRIREAKLHPGVRLRAGNVWIRFEAAAATPDQRASDAAATGKEHPELARAVPDSPIFLESDDEATPVDANVVHAVAADVGAQAFARDGRWFMKDPNTGEEIEIVPTGSSLAPAPELPAQREAAHKVRKKLVLATVGSLVAVLAIILVVGKLTRKPQNQLQYVPQSVVTGAVDQAVKAFADGKSADAIRDLKALQSQPLHPLWNATLRSILAALEADAATEAPGRSWMDHAVVASKRWEALQAELQKADLVKAIPGVVDLARKRLGRIQSEMTNSARLSEARHALEKSNYTEALQYATSIDADSIFRKEAEPIIPVVLETMKKSVTDEADRGNWAGAISRGAKLIEFRPELASEFDPKMAVWRRNEDDRKSLDQARGHIAGARYSEAIEAVANIESRSPYAKDAATLKAEAERKGALQLAASAYAAKDGEKALRLLAQGGDTESQLVMKIQSVIKLREEGLQAIKDRKFDEGKDKFKRITQIETDAANQYVKEAQGFVANMDTLVREQAKILVTEADTAVLNRDYHKARQKYEDAQRLDSAVTGARDGLSRLAKSAMKDYNWAINIEDKDPEAALQLYQEVRDRLSPVDKLYADAEVAIARLRTRLNKAAPAPAPAQ